MYEFGRIKAYKKEDGATEFIIRIEKELAYIVEEKQIKEIECRFDDGRTISNEQRKKAYATIKDVADFLGYLPEEAKELLKYEFISQTGAEYISLSSCTVDEAREFITFLIKFALEHDIPLSDLGVNRADDIGKYLYFCIKTRHCAICGAPWADIHHCEGSRVGMGQDRRKIKDNEARDLICLCRKHHDLLHSQNEEEFLKKYHVYGIKIKDFKEGE